MKLLTVLSCAVALVPCALPAQIVLAGTLGHSGALSGPNYQITANLGQQVGGNLFQSFTFFNLFKGEVATFSGPNSVQNVLARVTGGNVSSMDGTIQCTIPGASFFLINPAGVLFGPDAVLDIKGSFSVTTADYLKFADGVKFNAFKPSESVLTTAAPAAFGFLKSNPQSIVINGAQLSVGTGQGMTMVGGDIHLNGATLSAPDGAVNLTSVRSQSEVSPTAGLKSFAKGGDISFTAGAMVDVSGQQGGRIAIRGGNLSMAADSLIQAQTEGGLAGQQIDVGLQGDLDMTGNSSISAYTSGTGKAAQISVTANSISLTDGASLTAWTDGPGNGGEVAVRANSVTIDGSGSSGASGIVSLSNPGATGAAGDVTVNTAGQLALRDGGEISSSTYGAGSAGGVKVAAGSLVMEGNDNAPVTFIGSDSNSRGQGGPAGMVTVNIDDSASISGNAIITSDTFGTGKAGEVTVSAGSLTINGVVGETAMFTGISSESTAGAIGDAGSIAVAVKGWLALQNGGEISSSTFGAGAAGGVKVTAGSLVLKGNDNAFVTFIGSASLSHGQVEGGSAGTVTVNINKSVSISGQAEITSSTFGTGKAGEVTVTAESLSINAAETSKFCGISSDSNDTAAGGDAGTVTVKVAGPILIENAGAIGSDTWGQGQAGQVNVSAGTLALRGDKRGNDTHISSESDAGAVGNAGLVTVQVTGGISISGDAYISSDTVGIGNAGQVTVAAKTLSMNGMNTSGFCGISSESDAFGAGGDAGTVSVRVTDQVALFNNAEISTDTYGGGKAGSVNVWAGSLFCSGASSGVSSQAGPNSTGDAGDVNVIATGQISLSGQANLGSLTLGSGRGGEVSVTGSKLIRISGGASITAEASSSAPSDSGQIIVSGGNVQMNGGTINSEANGGSAGQVQVNSSGTLSLYQSQILAGSHQQNGGVIGISAPFLALNQSSVNGNAYHTGGTIDISTPNFVESTRSTVTATSQTGNPGKVEISSPQLTLSGNLVALSLPGLSAEAYLPAQCGKSLGGDVSSFIVLGHDGLPLEPGGWVTSFPEEQKDKGRQHPDSSER